MGQANIFNPKMTHDPSIEEGSQAVSQFHRGQRMTDHDGEEWVYVLAESALAAGQVVTLGSDFAAAPITTANSSAGKRCGVIKTPIPSGHYGWASRKGEGQLQVAANTAAARLRTSATAGQLGTSQAAGAKLLKGISLSTARGAAAGLAPGIWTYPENEA